MYISFRVILDCLGVFGKFRVAVSDTDRREPWIVSHMNINPTNGGRYPTTFKSKNGLSNSAKYQGPNKLSVRSIFHRAEMRLCLGAKQLN